jgi:hypothetical protein
MMEWFTEDADDDQAVLNRNLAAYSARLAEIREQLPSALASIALDPRFGLQDGRINEVSVNTGTKRVVMSVTVGDIQLGYRQLQLRFEGATIIPEDYQLLSAALRAEFQPDHWHHGRAITEVGNHEVDLLDDGRFVIRMRLRPFHTFGIEFDSLEMSDENVSGRGPARAGRFVLDDD